MTKILILTAAWQRREITRICYEGLKRLMAYNRKKYKIEVLIIESDKQDLKLAKDYGFATVYAENKPLGKKHNKGLEVALQDFRFDYLMQMGSDDLLANWVLDAYLTEIKKGVDIVGMNGLAVVDSRTKESKTFNYRKMIGAGRMFRRGFLQMASIKFPHVSTKRFIDKHLGVVKENTEVLLPVMKTHAHLDPKPGGQITINLWDNEINAGLDGNSRRKVDFLDPTEKLFTFDNPGLVDIKSDVNLTNYKALKGPTIKLESLYSDFPELKLL